MLYRDWVRGLVIPVAICVFGVIALVRGLLMRGAAPAPLLLAAALVALGVVRLRHFVAFRREARRRGT
jgi:hypothetical protein